VRGGDGRHISKNAARAERFGPCGHPACGGG
jgi:hypothetical protein